MYIRTLGHIHTFIKGIGRKNPLKDGCVNLYIIYPSFRLARNSDYSSQNNDIWQQGGRHYIYWQYSSSSPNSKIAGVTLKSKENVLINKKYKNK